jgi:hypothetical protein
LREHRKHHRASQDITGALATLFNTAVQSIEAHLSN